MEPKAFRVLVHLIRNPGRLIPKDELLNAGWGNTAVTDNSLTRNIALLRRLLEDDTRAPTAISRRCRPWGTDSSLQLRQSRTRPLHPRLPPREIAERLRS